MSLILFLRNSVRKESYLELAQPRDGSTEDHLHYPEYSIIAEYWGACSDPGTSLGILLPQGYIFLIGYVKDSVFIPSQHNFKWTDLL